MIDPKKSLWGALKNVDVQGLMDGAAQMAEGAAQIATEVGSALGETAERVGAGVNGAVEGFSKGFGMEKPNKEELDTDDVDDISDANEEMADLLEDIEIEDSEEEFVDQSFVDGDLQDAMDRQDQEAEAFAKKFLLSAIRLRGVKIEREAFLQQELAKKGLSQAQIDLAIAERPAVAGVDPEILDAIARESIALETNKSSWMSFATGLPGGLAMVGTIPADITQYYVHAFRIMQKLAYTYGWDNFLDEADNADDETLYKLTFFLSVMMGVGGANAGLAAFAKVAIQPAVAKQLAGKALTKTSWYIPMRHALKWIGINGVTKAGFGKAVAKVVPVIGGFTSAGLTYVTLKTGSSKLLEQLKKLPQAQPVPEEVIEEEDVVVEETIEEKD